MALLLTIATAGPVLDKESDEPIPIRAQEPGTGGLGLVADGLSRFRAALPTATPEPTPTSTPTTEPTATPVPSTPVPPTRVPLPPTVPPVPVASGSIAEAICALPWPCAEALYVAQHESGIAWVWNTAGSGACGPFQTLPCVGWLDIDAHLAEAYRKWKSCGGGSFWCAWFQWW